MGNPLLEEAIKRYGIPRCPYEPAFDRVVVYSVPEERAERDTFIEGGKLFKPETRKDYERNSTPRGVLVAAGLGARDVLRSHGMGLGHVVWVARFSPWRHVVDVNDKAREEEFLFLRVGDIVGSETLAGWATSGQVKIQVQPDGTHHYVTEFDQLLPRFDPPSYVA